MANRSQFAKVFSANIHDEACDHTICVAERTRKLNTRLNNYVTTRYVPYEIKRQLLNDDLYDYLCNTEWLNPIKQSLRVRNNILLRTCIWRLL